MKNGGNIRTTIIINGLQGFKTYLVILILMCVLVAPNAMASGRLVGGIYVNVIAGYSLAIKPCWKSTIKSAFL